MPTYEYACKSCGEHLEVVQSFKDEALTECPNCGGPLRKVFGNIGISFKGSGFYKTDSRSSPTKSSSAAPSPSSPSESSSSPAPASESSGSSAPSPSGQTKSDSGQTKSDSSSAKAS
ncbi:MAG: FmdB family transcriptional regulator [Actinomycetota bacterium]|nr:FmdB family transcriptional regulator [Actinomycetota bacterium]